MAESDRPPYASSEVSSFQSTDDHEGDLESGSTTPSQLTTGKDVDDLAELPSIPKSQNHASSNASNNDDNNDNDAIASQIPRLPSPVSSTTSYPVTGSRESSPYRKPLSPSRSRQSSRDRLYTPEAAAIATAPKSIYPSETLKFTSSAEAASSAPAGSGQSSENHNQLRDRSSSRPTGRGSANALLETVQEASVPDSSSMTPSSETVTNDTDQSSRLEKIEEDSQTSTSTRQNNDERGSENGGTGAGAPAAAATGDNTNGNAKGSETKEQTHRQSSGTRPKGDILPKRSTTSLSGARGKPADGSARNMIVETETVSSIPQVSLATVTGDRGGSSGWTEPGTLRMKPSKETIRPKREKKRTRKPPPGASSKADIFEAKVANAVDEADVSDSDETFVYESNPPDPYPSARQHRYHSRTPSTTSMASQAEQYVGGRQPAPARPGQQQPQHQQQQNVTGKRSMKFTNNTYNGGGIVDGDADGNGSAVDGNSRTIDGNMTAGSNHPHHLHHRLPNIGRHGSRGGTYPSLFDSDSPFDQAQPPPPRSPRHFAGFRRDRHSRVTAPNYRTLSGGGLKRAGDVYSDYDAEGADDERTPLMLPRPTRSRHGRRPNSATLRHMENLQQRRGGFFFSRYGPCLIISFVLLLLIGGGTTFIIAATKPLLDLEVTAVQNVLASEQEIMLDLNVQAANPNLFPVAVDDLDVNVFARSRFVGTDAFWREQQRSKACIGGGVSCPTKRQRVSRRAGGGVDHGTDPMQPSDPARDSQTMLLGRVFLFDSPVVFEPSPWNSAISSSMGQIRLARPGNKTEEGGTERWERVLQHPFELIVRGVVKYQLTLSSRVYSSPISSSVRVRPDDEDHSGH